MKTRYSSSLLLNYFLKFVKQTRTINLIHRLRRKHRNQLTACSSNWVKIRVFLTNTGRENTKIVTKLRDKSLLRYCRPFCGALLCSPEKCSLQKSHNNLVKNLPRSLSKTSTGKTYVFHVKCSIRLLLTDLFKPFPFRIRLLHSQFADFSAEIKLSSSWIESGRLAHLGRFRLLKVPDW